MSGCLDKKTLVAFASGDLAADAAATVEEHLEKCGRCAKALAALNVDDDLVNRIRDLEQSRAGNEPTTGLLKEIERRTTSTLFGEV